MDELQILRTRVGEMAAEIERLQYVIDEANAQEPVGYSLVFFGRDLPNMMTCFDSEVKAREYAAACARPDNFVPSPSPAPAIFPLYSRPIPAQKSPAIPNGVYENKCSCGSFFFGAKNQPFCAKCYDEKLRAQQSPAVAVPYGFVNPNDRNSLNQRGYAQIENKRTDYSTLALYEQPSPRITEQDAHEIINSAVNFMYETKSRHSIDYWLFEEGRALLNNLNGDKNGK